MIKLNKLIILSLLFDGFSHNASAFNFTSGIFFKMCLEMLSSPSFPHSSNTKQNNSPVNSISLPGSMLSIIILNFETLVSLHDGDGEQKEIPKTNITNILINESGKILLDDTPTLIKDIKGIAEKKMAANDKMIFSVQSHSKTKYNHYLKVLDQLKMAKATRISIANPDM